MISSSETDETGRRAVLDAGQLPDRISVNSLLIVVSFVGVLALSSQSGASYPTYALAITMLACVAHWNDVFRVKMVWLIAALLGYLAVSSFWSEPFRWRDVLTAWTRAALVFIFVVAFAECELRGLVRRWLGRAMAIVGLAAVVAATLVFYETNPSDGRLNGLGLLDTHVIAALVYAVVLVFVLDVALSDSSPAWRVCALLSAPAIAFAIFLSDSRNAWVSALVGAGVLILGVRVRDPQRFVAGVISMALVLSVVIAAMLIDPATREIILPRGDSFRPEIWASVLDRVIEEAPWFGHGINTEDQLTLGGLTFLHAHNMYLSVAYQGGIIALVMFLVLLAWVLSVLVRHYTHPDAKLALGILGVALPAYLLDGHELVDKVGSTWFLLWLPVAVAVGFCWRVPR